MVRAKRTVRKSRDRAPRFGIGEWFGNRLVELAAPQRRYYAKELAKKKSERDAQPCPFQSTKHEAKCTKVGGVCSIRLYSYEQHEQTGRAQGKVIEGAQGVLRATCCAFRP
jgi:hypothetical protein